MYYRQTHTHTLVVTVYTTQYIDSSRRPTVHQYTIFTLSLPIFHTT